MIETLLKTSLKFTFGVVVLSLAFSLAVGLYALWNPSIITESLVRTIATGLIILFASLFYTAACDVWFRVNSADRLKHDSKIG